MRFNYRQSVLDELARHGIIPRSDTPPELVHEFVNDLYRFEIRLLKKRLQAGSIAAEDYAQRVAELRERYPVLSLPVRFWLEKD